MKKAIKTTAKARNDKIFADFLSGCERSGSDWKSAYLNNPVLRVLARLIVWDQDGTTVRLIMKATSVMSMARLMS